MEIAVRYQGIAVSRISFHNHTDLQLVPVYKPGQYFYPFLDQCIGQSFGIIDDRLESLLYSTV
jgi:hypothetical protein